ncbi:zinc ribbon domain-containing protein, partial [Citrobacter sp. Cf120]|uniref:zinc ribbon domain-containing protein n=1 Tax=Citrobacter sp. Cf120 TaxID=2985070 RepID=UPI002577246E
SDGNGSHASTLKSPSYTKSVSWQHYPRCPECHLPLQVLKACGAVDYFCQNGHGLISKKRVEYNVIM